MLNGPTGVQSWAALVDSWRSASARSNCNSSTAAAILSVGIVPSGMARCL